MANERGRLYDTNDSTTILLSDTSSKIRIISEETDIQTGISKKKAPLLSSFSNVNIGVWGRSRVITVQGIKCGTQVQIEDWIQSMELWVNSGGFIGPRRYYPLFRATQNVGDGTRKYDATKYGNTVGSSNLQSGFYKVRPDSFNYKFFLAEVGYVCQWNLVMIEGLDLTDDGS